MHRRQYLKAAVASTVALSGCLFAENSEPSESPEPPESPEPSQSPEASRSFDPSEQSPESSESPEPSEQSPECSQSPDSSRSPESSPPPDARRKVSIGETDCLPGGLPVRHSLSVEDPWVTLESSAVLVGTRENTGDVTDDFPPLYYKGTSAWEGRPGLLLYVPEAPDAPPMDYVPPCFPGTPDGEYVSVSPAPGDEETVGFTAERYGFVDVAPGESRTDRLLVADDPTHDECLPPGEYTFESSPHLYDGEKDIPDWTFTVVVEEV